MNMGNFATTIAEQSGKPMPEKKQKKAGQPTKGSLDEEHRNFLRNLKELITAGEIDLGNPRTFLKKEVYDNLSEEWKEQADLALMNIATLLRQVYELYIRTDTPDESPQYQTMIEQLWQMKQRIEEHHDAFKF